MNLCKMNKLPGAVRLAGTNMLAGCHKIHNSPTLRHLLQDDCGQDLIEYALVAALVGLGAVTAMKSLKTSISGAFNSVGSTLTSSV